MAGGCPCCSTVAPALGKLLVRRRGSRRQKVDNYGEQWRWSAQGVAQVQSMAERYGHPNAGDVFTSEHLAVVAEVAPQFAQLELLAVGGFIVPATVRMEDVLQKYATQKRFFEVPASLVPAPPLVPAPEGQGVLVNTVLGPVASRALGMTLPHEHLFVSSAGLPQIYPELVPFEEEVLPAAVAKLIELKEVGGGAIVDCTTFDLGRDVTMMARVSEASGIKVVATTGLWMDPNRSLYSLDPDLMAKLFIRECTVGIQTTGIKAGIIKCAHETGATWQRGAGFTHMGEMSCRAAARAHKATGIPITTHTEVEEFVGLAQIAIFEEEGVDLNRVYIGHCNDSTNLEYLTAMLKKGVWLGLDRTGPGMAEPGVTRPEWEERANTIKRLVDAGWAHRIMLSHDWMAYMGFAGPEHGSIEHREKNPAGWTFILTKVIPRLHALGVTKQQTDAILYDNPVHFFEGKL